MAQMSRWSLDCERVLICLLGGFKLVKDGRAVWLRAGGRTESLLSALALGPREAGVPRDELVQTVWPALESHHAVGALSTLLYSLHLTLSDALGGEHPILTKYGRYRLNADAGVRVDIDRFDRTVETADRLSRAGDSDTAISSYREAAAMYAGDLVIGSDIQHLLERERLRARYLTVRGRLAEEDLTRGDVRAALEDALDVLAHDACREDAHRIVMRCYVRLGQRAQALRQYRVCRNVLSAEFDAPPEKATDELFELIRLEPSRV